MIFEDGVESESDTGQRQDDRGRGVHQRGRAMLDHQHQEDLQMANLSKGRTGKRKEEEAHVIRNIETHVEQNSSQRRESRDVRQRAIAGIATLHAQSYRRVLREHK